MIVGFGQMHARYDLLNIVSQELRQKIKKRNGNLFSNDIMAIARAVIVKENDDGSLFIFNRGVVSRDFEIPKKEVELIRKICSKQIDKSTGSEKKKAKKRKPEGVQEIEVDISSKKLRSIQGSVAIKRGSKRKAECEPENHTFIPVKVHKQEGSLEGDRIKIAKDFFDIDKGLPVGLMGLTTEYLGETPHVIVYLVKNKKKIPNYLIESVNNLDLSKQSIDVNILSDIIEKFKNLKSLKLPDEADGEWLEILSKKLPNLTNLDMSGCFINDISGLASLTNITSLDLSKCENIKDLTSLSSLKSLKSLKLMANANVNDISCLSAITSLESLNLFWCQNVRDISSLATLTSLKSLNLFECKNISDIHSLASLKSLTYLNLEGCVNIYDISSISHLKSLTYLNLGRCKNISDISSLSSLLSLTYLNLVKCENIRDISCLSSLILLRSLNLLGCIHINDIGSLIHLTSLIYLNLWKCKNIDDISSLATLTSLKYLNLKDCENIKDFSALLELDLIWCKH